jgi:hypothetical protein
VNFFACGRRRRPEGTGRDLTPFVARSSGWDSILSLGPLSPAGFPFVRRVNLEGLEVLGATLEAEAGRGRGVMSAQHGGLMLAEREADGIIADAKPDR